MLRWLITATRQCPSGLLAIFPFVFIGLLSAEAHAQEQHNPFEVRDVKVDVTAATASEARDQALADGERKAFQVLLDRLTLPADTISVNQFRPGEITSATQHFWVSEEKVSPIRYLATLNFGFSGERVKELLARKKIPFLTAISEPVLVVPVYEDENGARLWDVPNPWWDAWGSLRSDGLVPVMLPRGDANDFSVMDVQSALSADDRSLEALSARYGTSDAVVLLASLTDESSPDSSPAGAFRVTVINTRAIGLPFGVSLSSSYKGVLDEPLEVVLNRAAAATLKDIEAEWKTANVPTAGADQVKPIDVTVSNLGSWLALKERLQSLPIVHRVDTVMVSRTRVRVNLFYRASDAELEAQLRRAGFFVTSSEKVLSISRLEGDRGPFSQAPV